MCGIVGATAKRPITPILLEGLKHLEYRGYDSAGIAVIPSELTAIDTFKINGKVSALHQLIESNNDINAPIGIAHTRWATHGKPTKANAHPHSSRNTISLVHNGIIENHNTLREQLTEAGYTFSSQTDTEVIVHLLHQSYTQTKDMIKAISKTCEQLQGAYALGIIHIDEPNKLYAIRKGSPLVIGLGLGEHFIASDQLALLPVTQRFIHLEDNDIAVLTPDHYQITDNKNKLVERDIHETNIDTNTVNKGEYRHFMLKEIYDQPQALTDSLHEHFIDNHFNAATFGYQAATIFPTVKRVVIVACGTSYNAACVARDWIETLASLPCHIEIASEQRYRAVIVEPNTLFVAVSQSGETADTLAALRQAKKSGFIATLALCNVGHSTLAREADLTFITRAGSEIGVAATKTFTTQLLGMMILALELGQYNSLSKERIQHGINCLQQLPNLVTDLLTLNDQIADIAKSFIDKHHTLFLARGQLQAIAEEGALKLKEISYIHAESYFAGELKHGPLALVDDQMPVIVLAPEGDLFEKTAANIQEVKARGGQLIIVTDTPKRWKKFDIPLITMPRIDEFNQPIAYTIPMQLLAYHIAVLKGTDVDQPRNLAKSVTVE